MEVRPPAFRGFVGLVKFCEAASEDLEGLAVLQDRALVEPVRAAEDPDQLAKDDGIDETPLAGRDGGAK
jgi:hypothetical protein